MILRMAWRNLWRHTRRTLITTVSIAFGLWLAVTAMALGEHSYTTTIDTGAQMGAGHVTIQPQGYLEHPSLDKRVQLKDTLRQEALALPYVTSASERISGQAMFSAGPRSRGGAFLALDPAQETDKSNFVLGHMVEGEFLPDAKNSGVVLGVDLARHLGVKLGRKVVYTTTDVEGEMVSGVGRVKGLFQTGLAEVDGGLVILPLDNARQTLGYAPQEATQLVIQLDHQRYAPEVAAALEGEAPQGGAVLTWRQSMADLVGYIALDRTMNQFFQLIIGMLVAAGILNTLLMSVLERTREFGVMLALGTAPRRLAGLIMAESMFIGLVGLGIGALVTAPWSYYLYVTGIDMSAALGEGATMNGIAFDPVLRYALPTEMLIGILVTLFLLTLGAGAYPAWRASRVPPLEALRVI